MASVPPKSPLAQKIEYFESNKTPVTTKPVKRTRSAPSSPDAEEKALKKADTKTTPEKPSSPKARSSSRPRTKLKTQANKITVYYTSMSQSINQSSTNTTSMSQSITQSSSSSPITPAINVSNGAGTGSTLLVQPSLLPLTEEQEQQAIAAFNSGLKDWTDATTNQVFTPAEIDAGTLQKLSTGPPSLESLQALMVVCCQSMINVNSEIGKLTEQTKSGNVALGTMIKNLSIRADSTDAKIKTVQQNVANLEESRSHDATTIAEIVSRVSALEKREKKLTNLALSQEKSCRLTEFRHASYEIRIIGINFNQFNNPNRPNLDHILNHIMSKAAPGNYEYPKRIVSTTIAGKVEERHVRGKLMPKSAPVVLQFYCPIERNETLETIQNLNDPCLQAYDNIPSRLVPTFESFRSKANTYRQDTKKHAKVVYRRDKDLGFRLHMLSRDGPKGIFKPMFTEVLPLLENENDSTDHEMA